MFYCLMSKLPNIFQTIFFIFTHNLKIIYLLHNHVKHPSSQRAHADKLLRDTTIVTLRDPTQSYNKKDRAHSSISRKHEVEKLARQGVDLFPHVYIASPIPHSISLPTPPCIVVKVIILSTQHDGSIHNFHTNLKLESLMQSPPMLSPGSNMSTNG